MSSMGLDAGYVVLPPVAAALYTAVGRSPLVGLGAVFAGVSAGFSANLFLTSLDPLLAEFSSAGAHLIDPDYSVAATANWWFMIASTVLLTGIGWAVTAWWVEPRFHTKPPEEGGPVPVSREELQSQQLTVDERRALVLAAAAALFALGLFGAATWIPGAPLHGMDAPFPRWVRVIVPLIFLGFLLPGIVYGAARGTLRSDKDVARGMGEVMAGMGPYIVMAFFAAQFIAYFAHSGLGEMLALTGGQALARAALPAALLMVGFIAVVMLANLFIGSMSAKYAFFAPVFVPMFMQAGISPELTQVAYRIGDSVSNVITPLNPYVVILLVFMQRYVPRAGVGTLVALMLPYTAVFAVTWTLLLVAWIAAGFELGPGGPLSYTP
jgi:aminobenzoyl-glutamate transport protein